MELTTRSSSTLPHSQPRSPNNETHMKCKPYIDIATINMNYYHTESTLP